jgi:transmembrane sensor
VNAEAWFARMHSPDRTARDESDLQRWLDADPRNAGAYAECEKLAAICSELRSHHALVDELLADNAPRARPARRLSMAPYLGPMAAAAGAAAICVGLYLAIGVPAPEVPRTATTAKGQLREIALEDGSRIQLNSETVLDWRMGSTERRVELRRGEAFFDVARDPRRPFIVRAGSSEVRVVGTQFSVREDGGRLEVVVKEGKVDVIPDSVRTLGPEPPKVELTPGKRLSYDNARNLVRIATVDADRSLTWRTGSLDFDAVTLDEALAEVNRYAAKPLVVVDDRLRDLRVSGRFRVGDTDAVLFALRERFGIEAAETGDRIALRAQ